jgi:hypothetical protein
MEKENLDDFSLPTQMSIPEDDMKSCIIYGLPKCGKTTALSLLSNCLIIDTENGSDKISGFIKKVPEDKGPVGKMIWLDKFADELIKAGKPYDYVALDTFSEINDWAEWSGTYRYCNSVQGKSYNRELDATGKPIKGGPMLKPTDDNYESVHNLADGYGYRWSREDTLRMFAKYLRVAKKCIFYVCHVEDKYIGQKENTDVIIPKQLALTGKLRNILPRKVDAIGYVYNEDGEIKINFTGNEERVGGNRCKHIIGYNGKLDWDIIFPKNV